MEAHYNGHVIRVSVGRVPETDHWTFFVLVLWNSGNDGRVKSFARHGFEFGTAEAAMTEGFDFAMKWIDDGKPEAFTWKQRLL
jgi:hypothetical protein